MKSALTAEEWQARALKGTVVRDKDAFEHATAAILLHDQSFGFTWEDYDEVVAWADYTKNGRRHDRLSSLAVRIAALLPPREET